MHGGKSWTLLAPKISLGGGWTVWRLSTGQPICWSAGPKLQENKSGSFRATSELLPNIFQRNVRQRQTTCRKRHHQQSDFIRRKTASVYSSKQLVDKALINVHLGIIYPPPPPPPETNLLMQTFLTFPPAPVEWRRQVQPASVACSCRRWHWQGVGHRCWRCGDAPHAAAGVGSAPRRGCAPAWCWMGEPDKVKCTVMTSMSMTRMWSAPRCYAWCWMGEPDKVVYCDDKYVNDTHVECSKMLCLVLDGRTWQSCVLWRQVCQWHACGVLQDVMLGVGWENLTKLCTVKTSMLLTCM